MTTPCVICATPYTTGNGFSANRINSVANGTIDSNGFYNSPVFTYTIFSGDLCSYCPTNILDRNQQIIISNLELNSWVN
jgi:hypothetical protein